MAAELLPLRERVATFAVLACAEFLYGWSWSTVDTLRPQLRASVDASLTGIGALYSVQALGALIGAVALGQLGDRIGRRNVLAGVMVIAGTLLIASAWISSYPLLLANRFGLGMALGGVQPLVSSGYLGLFAPHLRGRLASVVGAVFTLGVLSLGAGLHAIGAASDWRLLLWLGGSAAVIVAPLLIAVMRDDRTVVSFGLARENAEPKAGRAPLRALFDPPLARLTLIVAVMAGCNYFATQAFQGWTSTLLSSERGFPTDTVGSILAWQAGGSLIGGFAWGWFGDRFGRRANAVGYLVGAALVVPYILLVRDESSFHFVGFSIGFALSASIVWTPWVAELFPDRLRATALSIFNWGRVVSLFAPLATGAVAQATSIAVAMLLTVPALLIVVGLWRRLPETTVRN